MDTRVARCLLLAHVLSADGIMAANEKAFLLRAMEGLDLDEEERQRVYSMDGLEEAQDVVRALDKAERRRLADELVQATLADGQLSPHELKAVKQLTAALELDDD